MTITVLLPVFNGQATIAQAIRSVRDQTYPDWQLLVLDDGSTDNTSLDAMAAIDGDPRCRYEPLRHIGLTGTLASGVEMATTPWIARLDADDMMMPKRLERQMRFVEEQPADVLGTAVTEISRTSGIIQYRPYPSSDAACRAALKKGVNPLAHSAVLMRRDAVLKAGNYNPRWDLAQDYALWLEIAKRPEARFGNLASPLTTRILHVGQRSNRGMAMRMARWRIMLHHGLPAWAKEN